MRNPIAWKRRPIYAFSISLIAIFGAVSASAADLTVARSVDADSLDPLREAIKHALR